MDPVYYSVADLLSGQTPDTAQALVIYFPVYPMGYLVLPVRH